jgi:glycine/D-amino acid oxidase-like deaminating enzyme
MIQPELLNRLRSHTADWDIIIVGGGATGVGVAIDAASRGHFDNDEHVHASRKPGQTRSSLSSGKSASEGAKGGYMCQFVPVGFDASC